MKLNKMTLIAALALGSLLTLSTGVNAQDATTNAPAATPAPAPAPMRGRGPNLEQLTKLLALTDDQKTNVQAVLLDQRKQQADLRQDTSLSPDDRRQKMKDIRDAVTAKMKTILTPDQFAKYQKIPMGGRRPAPAAAPAAAPASAN